MRRKNTVSREQGFSLLWCCSVVVVLASMTSCGRATVNAVPHADTLSAPIANLHAFSRLYGVVRWFHPVTLLPSVDWDQFAIEGVRRVKDIKDHTTLKRSAIRTLPRRGTYHDDPRRI